MRKGRADGSTRMFLQLLCAPLALLWCSATAEANDPCGHGTIEKSGVCSCDPATGYPECEFDDDYTYCSDIPLFEGMPNGFSCECDDGWAGVGWDHLSGIDCCPWCLYGTIRTFEECRNFCEADETCMYFSWDTDQFYTNPEEHCHITSKYREGAGCNFQNPVHLHCPALQ